MNLGVPKSALSSSDGEIRMISTLKGRIAKVTKMSDEKCEEKAKKIVEIWSDCGENYESLREKYLKAAISASSASSAISASDAIKSLKICLFLTLAERSDEEELKKMEEFGASEIVDLTMFYFDYVFGKKFNVNA